MARASKRDDVLDKADELFEKNGFVATGVNQITQEAGVASMTLYNNFKSKEDLIVAALERRSERFFDQLEKSMDAAGPSPRDRILAAFEALDAWIVSAMKAAGRPLVAARITSSKSWAHLSAQLSSQLASKRHLYG